MIYEPCEDSFLLKSVLNKFSKGKDVLDVGTGSGILALEAKRCLANSVTACDINPLAVKHVNSLGIKTIRSNLFSKVKGKFDLIIFNPPYLPDDEREDKESKLITTGGKNGDEIILKFLKQALKHLNENGVILTLVSSLTPIERINELISSKKLKKEIIARDKVFFEELLVLKIEKA